MKTIDSFKNEYEFLSNFFQYPVKYEDFVYPSTEHAFQAAKSLDPTERQKIRNARTAGHAKKLGRNIDLRKDWEFIKVDVMRIVLRDKFADPILRKRLLDTGAAKLVEGNHWGDTFWGVCKGQGKNWLGKLLMEIREEIQKEVNDDHDSLVNNIKHLPSPTDKLKAIRQVLFPIAQHFYNDAPDKIELSKKDLAALYVLCVNNKNWE